MTAHRIFSADSHFVEPPTMWAERMDAKFRDRAPRTIRGHEGKDGEFFTCENINPIPVSGFFGSGKTAEELPEHVVAKFRNDTRAIPQHRFYSPRGQLLFYARGTLPEQTVRTVLDERMRDWNEWEQSGAKARWMH